MVLRAFYIMNGYFYGDFLPQTSILDLQSSIMSSMNITYVMILDRMWWFWRLDVNVDNSQSNVMFIDVLWWVFNTTRAEIKGSWLVLNPENREKSLLLENIKVDIQSSMNITFHLKSSRWNPNGMISNRTWCWVTFYGDFFHKT